MSIKWQRIVYLAIIVVFLAGIITSVYYLLGGFEPIKVYKMESENRVMVGKTFYNHYTSGDPVEFGKRCRELLENKEIEGVLTIIRYQNDTIPDDKILQFIGITLDYDMAEIPRDFDVEEVKTGTRYGVFLTMHVLVQPRPPKIEAMIREAAAANSDKLQDLFVEFRYLDNSLSVEGWVNQ